jgi:N-acetylmuramic acid 6-phosphate etherase
MTNPLPPDRAHIATESRNPRTMDLHELSAADCVDRITSEDFAVFEAVRAAQAETTAFLCAAEAGFVNGGRLIYVGAGTSGRLGVLDASEAPPTFHVDPGRVVGLIAGGDKSLRQSSEGLEDNPDGAADALRALQLTADDSILAIAAGGTTPYARGALRIAKQSAPNAVTGFLTCSDVPAPDGADHMITIRTGPEVLTGSTRMKAGTATKLVLNTISTTLMIRSGRVYQNLMIDLKATNDKLRDRAARIISQLTGLTRQQSLHALSNANNNTKHAIHTHRHNQSA